MKFHSLLNLFFPTKASGQRHMSQREFSFWVRWSIRLSNLDVFILRSRWKFRNWLKTITLRSR